MSKKIGLIILVVLAFSLSACTREGSQAPTPTVKSKFPAPQAATTGMGVVEIAASQTAAALNGAPLGTPALVITATGTTTPSSSDSIPGVITPTPTDTGLPTLTTDPNATATKTSLPPLTATQAARPATYTLKEGEFVYCLARRFNVDPDQILSLNGLVDSETIYPGMTLKIPSSGSFPTSPRAWHAHPATYIVKTDDTIYSVACYYGDVEPLNIATANNLAAPYTLTVGAQIQIP